jgi:CRP-like cAMP-binding protein
MILVKGIAEIFTTFGDSEFKIEYLRQGDIINHTLFLYQQPALLPIRCVINCEALILTYEKITMIRDSKTESSLNRELERILANA